MAIKLTKEDIIRSDVDDALDQLLDSYNSSTEEMVDRSVEGVAEGSGKGVVDSAADASMVSYIMKVPVPLSCYRKIRVLSLVAGRGTEARGIGFWFSDAVVKVVDKMCVKYRDEIESFVRDFLNGVDSSAKK